MLICCCASSSVISPCPDLSWKVNFISGQILASVLPLCKFVKTVVGLYGKNALFLSPLVVVNDNGLISHVELNFLCFFVNTRVFKKFIDFTWNLHYQNVLGN